MIITVQIFMHPSKFSNVRRIKIRFQQVWGNVILSCFLFFFFVYLRSPDERMYLYGFYSFMEN